MKSAENLFKTYPNLSDLIDEDDDVGTVAGPGERDPYKGTQRTSPSQAKPRRSFNSLTDIGDVGDSGSASILFNKSFGIVDYQFNGSNHNNHIYDEGSVSDSFRQHSDGAPKTSRMMHSNVDQLQFVSSEERTRPRTQGDRHRSAPDPSQGARTVSGSTSLPSLAEPRAAAYASILHPSGSTVSAKLSNLADHPTKAALTGRVAFSPVPARGKHQNADHVDRFEESRALTTSTLGKLAIHSNGANSSKGRA